MAMIYIAILFFTLLAGEVKNLKISVLSLIPHCLFIVIAVFTIAYINEISSLYLIGTVDLLVRAILMPVFLFKCLKNRVETEEKPSISLPLSIALSIVVLSVGYHFIEIFKTSQLHQVLSSFSCGLTLFIYGLYLLLSKKDMVKMIISFFIIENGIHFLIISMIPHMSKLIEILLTFNFIVAVLFFVYLTVRLNEVFVQEEIKKFKESKSQRTNNET
ncbi:hypothetical protein [Thermodesulfovibrio sp.]|jgi:hydrogenase-4 component E|uniref:hypothetical protein n=2 Tax=Thermodesulfovibrio sp. TaxID=2067987 RepID=UPI003D0C4ECB